MYSPLDVLIVEDRESDVMLLLRELRRAGYAPNYEWVQTSEELQAALKRYAWQLVLADYSLPQFSGIEALRIVREWSSDVPFIIVSGAIGEETAVATMRAGADDYVLKGNLSRLGPAIERELRDADGRHARRHAEQELRLREALYRSLIENVADVIVILDDRGVVRYQSPSVERVLGYNRSESVGTRSLSCLHPDERSKGYDVLFGRIRRQRQIANLECRVRHKNGSWRRLEGTVTNLLDDPAVSGIVCNMRDITEREYLEKQLMRAQRMETIGNLAGGIAHDLNNLLTPLLVATDLLTGKLSTADRKALVETLQTSATRAVEVVEQLLSLARGVRGRRGVAHLPELVRDTERLLRFGFPSSIHIETAIRGSLWPVSMDATQMGQVLMNLCVNAKDAMPEGGRLTIEASNVSVREGDAKSRSEVPPGDYVQLSVADTGGGIPEEIQQRVFEPFFTTKDSGHGTGLGLWIVTRIVQDFGGVLNFESGVSGTRFSLYLPAISKTPTQPPPPRGAEVSVRGIVLIAEGEAALREIMKETLETYGCQTLVAADGVEALAVFRENMGKIGLVVMDIHLPIVDGPATIAAIKKLDPQAPIVLQYRPATDQEELQEVESHIRAFLKKPFTTEELLDSIREAVRLSEAGTGRTLSD